MSLSGGRAFAPAAGRQRGAGLTRENLNDVFRVDQCPIRNPKIDNNVVIFWRAEISRLVDGVLRAVGQAQHEGSKRPPFGETFGVHDKKVT